MLAKSSDPAGAIRNVLEGLVQSAHFHRVYESATLLMARENSLLSLQDEMAEQERALVEARRAYREAKVAMMNFVTKEAANDVKCLSVVRDSSSWRVLRAQIDNFRSSTERLSKARTTRSPA